MTGPVTSRRDFVRALLLALAAAPAAGRASAWPPCAASGTVHVVGHAWHTGVVLPATVLAAAVPGLAGHLGAPLVEVGWGDEAFYRAGTASASHALEALLWPTPSVLHLVDVASSPEQSFPQGEIVACAVGSAALQRAAAHVRESFAVTDGRVEALGAGLYGRSQFFRALGEYHALRTCNTWTAEVLRAAGVRLENRLPLTADDVMSGLREHPSRCDGSVKSA